MKLMMQSIEPKYATKQSKSNGFDTIVNVPSDIKGNSAFKLSVSLTWAELCKKIKVM
jgi:hypothetical protein